MADGQPDTSLRAAAFTEVEPVSPQAANTVAMTALMAVVPPSQILFGSDFPYRTAREHVAALAARGLAPETLRAIERENAVGLMPHLGA